MPIKYPTEFKVKAIRRYEKGESIKELCKELNISQSTLYHWRKQYCSIQTDTRTYTPAEFDAISRRLRKVEHELEVIRLWRKRDYAVSARSYVFMAALPLLVVAAAIFTDWHGNLGARSMYDIPSKESVISAFEEGAYAKQSLRRSAAACSHCPRLGIKARYRLGRRTDRQSGQ